MWNIILTALEIFEALLMANTKVLRLVITKSPAWLFSLLSKQKIIVYLNATAQKVPAYMAFLKSNGYTWRPLLSRRDISKLPETTKENYVLAHSLEQRMLLGKLPQAGSIDESAGSTGKATMWVRSYQEEQKLLRLITFALDYTFQSFSKKNIVVLNCWSNGPWATGIKFAFIAQQSTIVKAIGTNKQNVIDTITTLGNKYEYVLCGYPPFMKEVVDHGEEMGIKWSDYRVNIVTGGEGFSEGWRDFMRNKIKGSQGEVYSAYGASDIDIGIAFETDFSIALRKKLTSDSVLRKRVLRDERIPLFIGQYNPLIYYIEVSPQGELIYTLMNQKTASPKIRYNLKDSGTLLDYSEAAEILSAGNHRQLLKQSMKLPLVVVYGRSDGTISLDGANIYPADVQHALFSSDLGSKTHSFFLDTAYEADQSIYFAVHLELTEQTKLSSLSQQQIQSTTNLIISHLSSVNQDFAESYENNRESLTPQLHLHEYGSDQFKHNTGRIKHAYYAKKSTVKP